MTPGLEWGAGPWTWAAAGLAAAAAAWGWGRTPAALRALRAAGAAAVVLGALRPSWSVWRTASVKPRLLVLVDASASMSGRGAGAPTRLEQSRRWLARHRRAIEARAEVTLAQAGGGGRVLGGLEALGALTPGAEDLRLSEALRTAWPPGRPPPDRVWLLSDGAARGEGSSPAALAALRVPADAVGAGPARAASGPSFAALRAPDFAFLHERAPVEAEIEVSGAAGREASATLWRADPSAPGGWREAGRLSRRILGDPDRFPVSFSPRADFLGGERFRLVAEAAGRRVERELRVEVVRQKYRVMYLAGRPGAEYQFLREFLKSNPSYELVSFVILRNPENPSPAPDRELSLIPFPADDIFGPALAQFDLFILENFSAARFRLPPGHLRALRDFVAAGGALLVKGGESAFNAGGYRGSPLEEILPVSLSSREPDFADGLFSPRASAAEHPLLRLGEDARASRQAWEALPPLDGWGRFASLRSGAEALLVHPAERCDDGSPLPVAAVRPHGRGRVMLMSTGSTWRWRLGASGDASAGAYERFWSRAVQYLTGSLDVSKVRFAPVPDRLEAREPAVFSLRVFDEDFGPAPAAATEVEVSWEGPDGKARAAPARYEGPGAYRVELTGLSPGGHRLGARARVRGKDWGRAEARFSWEGRVERPLDREWLSAAARAAGGTFLDSSAEGPGRLLAHLPPARPAREEASRASPFSGGACAAAGLLLLCAEWAWRRRRGLA